MKKRLIICLFIFFSIGCCTQCKSNDKYDPKGEFLSIIATSYEKGDAYLLINQFFVPSKNEKVEMDIDEEKYGFTVTNISTLETVYSEDELAHSVQVYKVDFGNLNTVTINTEHFKIFPNQYKYYLPIEINKQKD